MVLQVLNSKYNRIYGTIESMVSAKLCDESNKPPKDPWALYIYIYTCTYNRTLIGHEPLMCSKMCFTKTELLQQLSKNN